MTLKRLLGLVGVMAAVAALASSVGAAPTPAKHTIRLSTTAAVKHYVRSLGISPKGIVIQRGAKNYAGARCPGKGWTCTSTRHAVVQVARPGGKNTFACATKKCSVIQFATATAATNTARCINTSGVVQACLIIQSSSSANNQAIVVQTANVSGLTQAALLGADIRQRATGASNSNKACVLQTVNGTASTNAGGSAVTVTMEGHQAVKVVQDSAHGGNTVQNASAASGGSCVAGRLNQTQTLTSNVKGTGSITQRQNALNLGANVWLDIEQNQSSGFFGTSTGSNIATFNQTNTLTAVASTPTGPVKQTQSSVNGGILAKVNQDSRDLSTADALQTETQCADALTAGPLTCATATQDPPGYPLTQTQFGPVRKGGGDSIQTGNPGDTFTVVQSSTQDNDTGSNQTNVVQADCTTSGNCTAAQTAKINGQTTTNTQSGPDLDTTTNCTGSDCNTTCNGVECIPPPTFTEDGSQLTAQNVDVKEFGAGGMRGDGTGSIAVSGVTGTVRRALLYWNGPTNSEDPDANAAVSFAGTAVTGTNIGIASDNCWGYVNSHSYRADVTALVGGDGAYSLADFVKRDVSNNVVADINGVALVVFYTDTTQSDDRNVVLWSGNDSNVAFGADPAGWDETLTGVPYSGGSASLDFVVADGQSFEDGALVVNGTTIAPAGSVFDGDTGPNYSGNGAGVTGSLWDVKSFDISSVPSSNNLHVTSDASSDCLSLVVAAANVPASAPVPLLAAAAATPQHATAAQQRAARPGPTGTPLRSGGNGGAANQG